VCNDHCAKNIVLSSRLLQPTYAELGSIHTPILATGLNQADLPQQLVFKYACFACTSRTIHTKPPPTASSEQSEAEALRSQLARLQAELESKTSDVTALSDMMHVYSERLVSLQDTIETLESQLRENSAESATNIKKRRQLSELREELQRLTPMHSYYNTDCKESENYGTDTVNLRTTKYASPPPKASNNAYNGAPEEPSVSTMFYTMLSQAYEGIVAVTPSVLKSTAYSATGANASTKTNRNTNTTTSTSNNNNTPSIEDGRHTKEHNEQHRGAVEATQPDRLGCTSTTSPVRVLFPHCDNTHDTFITSDPSIGEVNSLDERDANSAINGACFVASTRKPMPICAVASDDSTCFTRVQSAHVDYCDIYACVSADEYMTHSVAKGGSFVPSTLVRGTSDNNGAREDCVGTASGGINKSTSERSAEYMHGIHMSKVEIMEGVFMLNPLMIKRKSL